MERNIEEEKKYRKELQEHTIGLVEREMKENLEDLKQANCLDCVFLKIDLVIDNPMKENTKTDRVLDAIREVCKKEELVMDWIVEDNDHIVLHFWEYNKKKHMHYLTTHRNKLSREISTLKKASLKK